MKLKLKKTRIQHLIAHRNGYLVLGILSLITNVILTVSLVMALKTEKIILVPPEIEQPMWVTAKKVSPEYLSGMSLYLSNLLLNVTASSAPLQHQLFLKIVDSKNYQHIKGSLAIEEEKLQKEHMSIHFQLDSVKTDVSHLIAHIAGNVEYRVGEAVLPVKHLTYALQFSYTQGFLKLLSFEEIKNDNE
jgi:conjugal transfer pilus assembly protein TraE